MPIPAIAAMARCGFSQEKSPIALPRSTIERTRHALDPSTAVVLRALEAAVRQPLLFGRVLPRRRLRDRRPFVRIKTAE
jgi:hypothetical protein